MQLEQGGPFRGQMPLESPRITLVETRIGPCGLVWVGDVIVQVVLSRFVDLPLQADLEQAPAAVAGLLARLMRHIDGSPDDFQDVRLPLETCSTFCRRVYEETRKLPPGETCTYGEFAEMMGKPGAARAVGSALRKNPWPILVPSHRYRAKKTETQTSQKLEWMPGLWASEHKGSQQLAPSFGFRFNF